MNFEKEDQKKDLRENQCTNPKVHKKMARKKCSKCNSTKIIKKGSKMENNAFNARFAITNL